MKSSSSALAPAPCSPSGSPGRVAYAVLVSAMLPISACESGVSPTPTTKDVYGLANGCFAVAGRVRGATRYLQSDDATDAYVFRSGPLDLAVRFHARAADLGVYLLRDAEGRYLVPGTAGLAREDALQSDVLLGDDTFISPAEWTIESAGREGRFLLRNRAAGGAYLTATGTTSDVNGALELTFEEATGCAPFPEMSLDAEGTPTKTTFDDGDLYGFVDAHSHLLTNFGFGGAGTFHGSPFHRLGVEHALPDCEPFHGWEGRRNLLGYFFDRNTFNLQTASVALLLGEIQEFDHETAGYPNFTDWPNAPEDSVHQAQYYRWLERAYLSGLRLVVQHATSNQVLCDMVTAVHAQTARYSCNDMVAVERQIDEAYALERYVDAQSGGPGRGWFRIVRTPAEARQVIGAGKLAVVLGIETSNLFDCFLTPRAGFPTCDATTVRERLDHFQARGVRAIFPVHKYDNAFSAGDGARGFIEFGNFINSGHYSNFTLDCDFSIRAVFDNGNVVFGGINQPRATYDEPAPVDMSGFATSPVSTLLPYISVIGQGSLQGAYCQNAGLTALGETLLQEMMLRGLILEIDHLPTRSYHRAIDMLVANDYPSAGTHGNTAGGIVFDLGGIVSWGLPRCGNAADPASVSAGFRNRIADIAMRGGYPAQGLGFDLNGLAGSPGPRFTGRCGTPQENPITYPFTSYDGAVTFTQPMLGTRVVDFNTEGMVHLGLLPELIEDARHMGFTDQDLEPLFRSAEGYVRMWERAEARGAALRALP